MPKPVRIPVKLAPQVLNSISVPMKHQPSPELGRFIAGVVKDPRRRRAFAANPERVLAASNIPAASVNLPVLIKLIDTITIRLPDPDIFAETSVQKNTSESQSANFDHSSSWFANKDGHNVIYERGHSTSQSTGEYTMQEKNFGGVGFNPADQVIINDMLGSLFFPAQPLVSPELIALIKASAKKED